MCYLQYKLVPSEVEPKTTEEALSHTDESGSAADANASAFLVVESPIPHTEAAEEGFVVVEKTDAVDALAYYIAMCVMNSPEAQAVSPAVLQQALVQTLRVSAHPECTSPEEA